MPSILPPESFAYYYIIKKQNMETVKQLKHIHFMNLEYKIIYFYLLLV